MSWQLVRIERKARPFSCRDDNSPLTAQGVAEFHHAIWPDAREVHDHNSGAMKGAEDVHIHEGRGGRATPHLVRGVALINDNAIDDLAEELFNLGVIRMVGVQKANVEGSRGPEVSEEADDH